MEKKEEKEKTEQASQLRGEAKAYATVGGLGAVGWAAAELGVLFIPDALDALSNIRNKTWRRIGFATGIVAMGAMIVSLVKHQHAVKIDSEKQQSQSSFLR